MSEDSDRLAKKRYLLIDHEHGGDLLEAPRLNVSPAGTGCEEEIQGTKVPKCQPMASYLVI